MVDFKSHVPCVAALIIDIVHALDHFVLMWPGRPCYPSGVDTRTAYAKSITAVYAR